ncbi:MAG TPA: hypothetical protein VN847_17190 [Streptosporangiaceae bacterium]|nr:hypothetical protein [Streptosporangiaceae bacterium]
MFALLPVIGGFLAGWLAPRRVAIGLEIALFVIGAVVFTLTAPSHHTSYADGALDCIPMAAVSAGATVLGIWLRRRRERAVTS